MAFAMASSSLDASFSSANSGPSTASKLNGNNNDPEWKKDLIMPAKDRRIKTAVSNFLLFFAFLRSNGGTG